MKRLLLMLGAAVVLVTTLAVPTAVRADGVGNTNCGGQVCKPLQ